MIQKVKEYCENRIALSYYADSSVEYIALLFLVIIYFLIGSITAVLLFLTCPLWIIPYCIYKSKRSDKK